MADLSPLALKRFLDAVTPQVVAATGLPRENARSVAVSLIPPFAADGTDLLLRNPDGVTVGRIPMAELDPVAVLEAIARR